jgi:hypothetical protein
VSFDGYKQSGIGSGSEVVAAATIAPLAEVSPRSTA